MLRLSPQDNPSYSFLTVHTLNQLYEVSFTMSFLSCKKHIHILQIVQCRHFGEGRHSSACYSIAAPIFNRISREFVSDIEITV